MMKGNSKVGVLLYRYNNNELEVFLVGENNSDQQNMQLPQAVSMEEASENDDLIHLEENKSNNDVLDRAMAIEAKIEHYAKKFIHVQQEEGTYVAVKEAFKKILPEQYAYLKELQEILRDRNSVMNM